MAGRDVIDGNVVKWDLDTPGQAKAYITDGDDEGTAGQVLTSGGPGQPRTWETPVVPSSTIDFQRFNTSGTWNKPTGPLFGGNSVVYIRIWGGGGGGQAGGGDRAGGGGGGFNDKWMTLSQLGTTETATVGSGGGAGANGGNSTFGTHITGYAGSTGGVGTGAAGGGGGGPMSAGAVGTPGNPTVSDGTNLHGSSINDAAGRNSIWHGGGGAGSGNFVGGNSVYGGGGGGGCNSSSTFSAGGTSVHGGAGGQGNGSPGVQPGGGGGADDATAGSGGNGRIDVIVFPFP